MNKWYRDKVIHGNKGGKTIGYPTINLNPQTIPANLSQGVYSCVVKFAGKTYVGALYFGPRLVNNETVPVLEIYILDFSKEIYGEIIEFFIHEYIREVMKFESFDQLKTQIKIDVEAVRQSIGDPSRFLEDGSED